MRIKNEQKNDHQMSMWTLSDKGNAVMADSQFFLWTVTLNLINKCSAHALTNFRTLQSHISAHENYDTDKTGGDPNKLLFTEEHTSK